MAVVRDVSLRGEDDQFVEIWSKNALAKSINLTASKKHGKVYYGDDLLGCLAWSHSRDPSPVRGGAGEGAKAESFFQTESPEWSSTGDEEDTLKMEKINPVTNMASMMGSTDIPDWCMVEAGFEYTTDCLPQPAVWGQMLNKSPIKHVAQVKTPVLLMLGEDDKQGMEHYRAVEVPCVPVRVLWYPGNNHSLSKVDAVSDGFMNMAL